MHGARRVLHVSHHRPSLDREAERQQQEEDDRDELDREDAGNDRIDRGPEGANADARQRQQGRQAGQEEERREYPVGDRYARLRRPDRQARGGRRARPAWQRSPTAAAGRSAARRRRAKQRRGRQACRGSPCPPSPSASSSASSPKASAVTAIRSAPGFCPLSISSIRRKKAPIVSRRADQIEQRAPGDLLVCKPMAASTVPDETIRLKLAIRVMAWEASTPRRPKAIVSQAAAEQQGAAEAGRVAAAARTAGDTGEAGRRDRPC